MAASPRAPGIALAFAWCGAAVFAGSLLFFLYSYLITFGRPAESIGVVKPVAIDGILFAVFALHHSVFARPAVKSRLAGMVSVPIERSIYTWIASVLFIAVCTAWRPVPGTLYRLDPPWRYAADAVQILGIILTLRASRALGVLELAGVRRAQPKASTTTELRTTGLYGFVRHPLYFAWTLLVFGTPDMTATRFVFAFVSTFYLALAVPWEERGLVATFGRDYERYRKSVRWRMIPGVY